MENKKTLCPFCNIKSETKIGKCVLCNRDKERYLNNLQDAFDDIIHYIEATANNFYGPNDKMWNILLKTRDNLNPKFQKEIERLEK